MQKIWRIEIKQGDGVPSHIGTVHILAPTAPIAQILALKTSNANAVGAWVSRCDLAGTANANAYSMDASSYE